MKNFCKLFLMSEVSAILEKFVIFFGVIPFHHGNLHADHSPELSITSSMSKSAVRVQFAQFDSYHTYKFVSFK